MFIRWLKKNPRFPFPRRGSRSFQARYRAKRRPQIPVQRADRSAGCQLSMERHGGWQGSKMLMEHLWNIYGTSMEHLWHHRWNIYGLGLENWMKTGDDFHGVGIGLMPWDASNHPMFENWILGHQIIPNLELESWWSRSWIFIGILGHPNS